MCILFVYINNSPLVDGYQLIIANNRDESYKRPSRPAAFWKTDPSCISGLDFFPGREGGTWFGMSRTGKIGALLNILVPGNLPQYKKARGYLVTNYISKPVRALDYLKELSEESETYNRFNLVLLERSMTESHGWQMHMLSNAAETPGNNAIQNDGVYGVSNSVYDRPFKKVQCGKDVLRNLVKNYPTTSQKRELKSALFKLMTDQTWTLPDEQLKSQGGQKLCGDLCGQRSAIYVNSPEIEYGTRTITLLLIDAQGNCDYLERTMREPINTINPTWDTAEYNFRLEEPSKL